MLRFALRRAASALLTLLGVLALVFGLVTAAPGDAAALAARAGGNRAVAISPEALAAFRHLYGLDRPLTERFLTWVWRAARLDFGRSLLEGQPVTLRVSRALPATLALNTAALLLATLIGVPLGVMAARRSGGRLDRISGFVCDALFSTPTFVLGLVFLLVFSCRLRPWRSRRSSSSRASSGSASRRRSRIRLLSRGARVANDLPKRSGAPSGARRRRSPPWEPCSCPPSCPARYSWSGSSRCPEPAAFWRKPSSRATSRRFSLSRGARPWWSWPRLSWPTSSRRRSTRAPPERTRSQCRESRRDARTGGAPPRGDGLRALSPDRASGPARRPREAVGLRPRLLAGDERGQKRDQGKE